nr:uncharacterized protein LOC113710437 [Coffea arabica]
MECCTRPNRSDVHVSKEEEAKLEESTRDYFDAMAPKRHTKPQRSDYSKTYTDSCSDDVIPEHVRFQLLENDPQKLGRTSGSQATEEFVEKSIIKISTASTSNITRRELDSLL